MVDKEMVMNKANDVAEDLFKEEFRINPDKNYNRDADDMAYLLTAAIIVLSVFTPNIFSGIYGILSLIVLNGTRETYDGWARTVKSFFYISIVFLVLFTIIFALIFVYGLLAKKLVWLLLGIYVGVLSIALIFLLLLNETPVMKLYSRTVEPDLSANSLNPTYGVVNQSKP